MESGTLKGHIAMGAAAIIWGLMSPVSKLVMVAAVVVVVAPAAACAVAGVPDVRTVCHRAGLPAVDLLPKPWVYRAAIAAHAAPVEFQCLRNQAFVARHDVGKVPKALRRVPLRSDVDVNSTGYSAR